MKQAVLKWTLVLALWVGGVLVATAPAKADVWYPVRPVVAYAWQPVYYTTPYYGWNVYRPWRPVVWRVFHPFQRLYWGASVCCDTWTVVDPCCDGVVVEKSGTPTKAEPKKTEPTKAPEKRLTPAPGPASDLLKSDRDVNDARPAPTGNTATFSIEVPADAKVLINGHETRSTGTRRTYASHGLQEGNSYQYAVRVLIPHEGQASYQGTLVQHDGRTWIELAHDTTVQAGDRVQLAFSAEGRMNRFVKLASLPVER